MELLLSQESAKNTGTAIRNAQNTTEDSPGKPSAHLASIFAPASQLRAPSQVQSGGKQSGKMKNTPSSSKSQHISFKASQHAGFSSAWRRPTDSQTTVQTRIENGALSGLKRSVSMCGPISSVRSPIAVGQPQPSAVISEAEPRPLDCTSPVKIDAADESSHLAASDIFAATAAESASSSSRAKTRPGQPLADRMRPTLWADFVGQAQVRDVLKELSLSGFLPSMILWGPPGGHP